MYLVAERPLAVVFISDPERPILTDEMDLLAVLQHDIAERLRPVCGTMSELEFERLVRDIAAVKLKYGVEAELSAAFRERLTAAVDDRQNQGRNSRSVS